MAKNSQEALIREEQEILDHLIKDMDEVLKELDGRLDDAKLRRQRAIDRCLPETYGDLIKAEGDRQDALQKKGEYFQSRNELYNTRLELQPDNHKDDIEELKVGLHTFMSGGRIFVISWLREACRGFMLNDSLLEDDCYADGGYVHYKLLMKRKVGLRFDIVESVLQMYPNLPDEEKIIADEFLLKLIERRAEKEFRNIVFSIQKRQGEIIQTPYQQNLIVQGCAGSGKSMIMLHRLPIILYDNPKGLSRNNLYIITPSTTYIQMMENMRSDLEIEDLKMGTLEQYYAYVIEKYDRKLELLGTIKPYLRLTKEQEGYIYSTKFTSDIQSFIWKEIKKIIINTDSATELLGMKPITVTGGNPASQLLSLETAIQSIITKNNEVLRRAHGSMRRAVNSLSDLLRMLSARRIVIVRELNRRITEEQDRITNANEDLKTLDEEVNKIAIRNRKKTIELAEKSIEKYNSILKNVESEGGRLAELKGKATHGEREFATWLVMQQERENIKDSVIYKALESKSVLCFRSQRFIGSLKSYDDGYEEYVGRLEELVLDVEYQMSELQGKNWIYLPFEQLEVLKKAQEYYSSLRGSLVDSTYNYVMKHLGQERDRKNNWVVPPVAAYVYLQILFQYQGAPNKAYESLITIDEAQNVDREELKLIKGVNKELVVLNLFGDIKQHIEGSKGIDNWKNVNTIADFQFEEMHENYRNARQITEYCNKRFKLNMTAINLSGSGVHEIKGESEFRENVENVFQKPIKPGLSGILVANREEAKTLLKEYQKFEKLNDMTGDVANLDNRKWNVLTVSQAKGLEFNTVFALSGRMSKNEKYIAYTRALDELYVYDEEFQLSGNIQGDEEPVLNTRDIKPMRAERPKRVKRASKM